MNAATRAHERTPVLSALRGATGELHRQLEDRLDGGAMLANPATRGRLVARYADLLVPADAMLSRFLGDVEALGHLFGRRSSLLADIGSSDRTPFPRPDSRAEAMGMLYVVEGATLGGRTIVRSLRARGVDTRGLEFLDPHGSETGAIWRSFIEVLENMVTGEKDGVAAACRGSVTAFRHAELVLCGPRA